MIIFFLVVFFFVAFILIGERILEKYTNNNISSKQMKVMSFVGLLALFALVYPSLSEKIKEFKSKINS